MGARIGFLGSVGLPFVAQDSLTSQKDSEDAVLSSFPESGNICLGNPDLGLLEFGMAGQISKVDWAGIKDGIQIGEAENLGCVSSHA